MWTADFDIPGDKCFIGWVVDFQFIVVVGSDILKPRVSWIGPSGGRISLELSHLIVNEGLGVKRHNSVSIHFDTLQMMCLPKNLERISVLHDRVSKNTMRC